MNFEWLQGISLNDDDFDIADKEALIEDFIFTQSLNLIYSPPKQGKTFLTWALSLKLVSLSTINTLFYLDMDNSLSTLKERTVDKVLVPHYKVEYITTAKLKEQPLDLLKEIAKGAKIEAYKGMVFIVDTAKDFIDISSHSRVVEFLGYCVKMRDAGATVIVLHHSNKNEKNISGDTAFLNTPDNIYKLRQSSKRGTILNFELTVTHARGLVKDVKYSVDTSTLQLSVYDAVASGLSDADMESVEKGLEALRKAEHGLSESALILGMGFKTRTDRSGKRLAHEMVGHYWDRKKINAKQFEYYIKE